jgi:uroporphyrinogen decarboxylase
MNKRQRFNATMNYQARDRSSLLEFGYWDETLELWQEQGLPVKVDKPSSHGFFGLDFNRFEYIKAIDVKVGLVPSFEEKVLEDLGDKEVIQQQDGTRVLRHKSMSSIPMHLGHLLEDRDSWKKHYKPRLDPSNPDRYPSNWDERVKVWTDPDRDYPVFLWGGSLYGCLRDWMGLEKLSLTLYDDPTWIEEMVGTLADCTLATLTRALETGGQFDACGMWEDICYKSGPLISPPYFKKLLVPHYRRIADLLYKHGVDIIWVDCDGDIDKLVPLWLEAGINCMIPFEVGTWGADPIQYRQKYGKDLRMMGGFSKRILAKSKREIEREVYRLAPLVEEGGYIGFCDHYVPPDVPLENYVFYLETTREVWGKGVNLSPLGALDRSSWG